jgi:hypothetical protein
MLVRARAIPASLCTLELTSATGAPFVERATFADEDGNVFWLVTIPANTPSGSAGVVLDCGDLPYRTSIAIEP